MIDFLNECIEIQARGKGNYSINTIMTYREYFLKYRFYISQGYPKMAAYEHTGYTCGACVATVRTAVKFFES